MNLYIYIYIIYIIIIYLHYICIYTPTRPLRSRVSSEPVISKILRIINQERGGRVVTSTCTQICIPYAYIYIYIYIYICIHINIHILYIHVSLRCLVQGSGAGLQWLKACGCGGVNSSHTVPVQYPLQYPLKTYGSSTVHIKYL